MKVVLETLGCKLNQAETESLAWELANSGYEVVSEIGEADIFVLNTCTVTNTADAKSRHRVRQVHKNSPAAFIVVTGCYAQREAATLKQVPGVGLVVSNQDKSSLVDRLKECRPVEPDLSLSTSVGMPSLRTRSFIKVQDGCSGACAYCIVPQVRQGETSIPIEDVITQIKHRESTGFKEVVLTGTKVGCYLSQGRNLKDLLAEILAQTGVPRIRLSSLQPQEISPDLLGLWQDSRLLPHFHMALQSGSDAVLRRMKRRYNLQTYKQAVGMIRDAVPGAAITTDIIVGFPGETDALFEESYRTCAAIEYARIHVFPFSSRPGTEAAAFPDIVSDTVKHERSRKMLALATKSLNSFKRQFRGQQRAVLWETRDVRGNWTGWTDNYIQVRTRGEDLAGKIQLVKIE